MKRLTCIFLLNAFLLNCGHKEAKTPKEAFELAMSYYENKDAKGLMSQLSDDSIQYIEKESQAFRNHVKHFPEQVKQQIAGTMKISMSNLDSFEVYDYFRYKINLDKSRTQNGFTATFDGAKIKSSKIKDDKAELVLELVATSNSDNIPDEEGSTASSKGGIRTLNLVNTPRGWKLQLFSGKSNETDGSIAEP